MASNARSWNIVLVEDDPEFAAAAKADLEEETLGSPPESVKVRHVSELSDIQKSMDAILSADIAILDIKTNDDDVAGIELFEHLRHEHFVPVVFFSGYAVDASAYASHYVRCVSKGDGVGKLICEIRDIFDSGLVNLLRHLRAVQREFFWRVLPSVAQQLTGESDRKEPAYLLARGLASELSEERLRDFLGLPLDAVHPIELYQHSALPSHLTLGDVRDVPDIGACIVLSPSCDLVDTGGRRPKVGNVLVAKIKPLKSFPQWQNWEDLNSNGNKKQLCKLLTNTEDRHLYFLPRVNSFPDSIADFRDLFLVPLDSLAGAPRLAVLAAPYAESLSNRFTHFFGRLGTPDLNTDIVLERAANTKTD